MRNMPGLLSKTGTGVTCAALGAEPPPEARYAFYGFKNNDKLLIHTLDIMI